MFLPACINRAKVILANWEQPTYGKWVITGTAFGEGPAHHGFANQKPVTGYIGNGLVDSYLPGDEAEGTLTSPPFKIERKFINFLIGGGYQPGNAGICLLIAGKKVRNATGKSITDQDTEALTWQTWNVAKLQGRTARIEIYDHARGGWGHVNIGQIEETDEPKTQPIMPTPTYHEKYRPQFHFSARRNWLNDPNGLVYANGIWHLFFQYNSKGIQSDYKNWGHAESPDLFHWKQLSVAIRPDKLGEIWSGSAALDASDSSGLGKDGKPPLVAMYTAAGSQFGQCLAFSNDGGVVWQKYNGNPVLPQIAYGNRDPRIFWYEPKHEWILVLYIDGNTFGLFSSPNLKQWHELSRFTVTGSAECPELFPIQVQNEPGVTKWVFYAGNYHYVVGTFDGTHFTPDQAPIQGDFGDCFYASQTYNGVARGRRVQIGWMRGDGPMPGNPFNQQMSIPCDLTLHQTAAGYRLYRWPVREIETLYGRSESGSDLSLVAANSRLKKLRWVHLDLEMTVKFASSQPVVINVFGTEITLAPQGQKAELQGIEAPMAVDKGTASIRLLVDSASIELFINGGIDSMTRYFMPAAPHSPITLSGGNAVIQTLHAHEVKSVWK